MYNVKVFTWNMQRAHSISRQDATARERYRVLKNLVDWADFGFITEPGKDIRDNLNNFGLPLLNRNFCRSQMYDNQSDGSACRPVIYSKFPFSRIPPTTESYISYLSGADDAYRYPAAGIVSLARDDGQGHKELLLLSFHATSGFGADANCQAYFDSFYQVDYQRRDTPAIPLLWIVGGDFNCNPGKAIYMPQTFTHQSKHVLDGFFADQNGTNFQVTASTDAQTFVQTNGGEGELKTNTSVNPHGYVVNGHHLSDHCPVFAQLQIGLQSEVDTSNIVTGKRARRKSTRYQDVEMTS